MHGPTHIKLAINYLHTQNTETVIIQVYTTREIKYACVHLASGLYQSEIRRVL